MVVFSYYLSFVKDSCCRVGLCLIYRTFVCVALRTKLRLYSFFPDGGSCSNLGGTYRKKSFTAQEYFESVPARAASGDVASCIGKAEL